MKAQMETNEKEIEIYVARDGEYTMYEDYNDYEHDRHGIEIAGDLHIFYDKPVDMVWFDGGVSSDENGQPCYKTRHRRFTNARICAKIPNYMFPMIGSEQCVRLSNKSIDEIVDKLHKIITK